jgi:hypothetical protein
MDGDDGDYGEMREIMERLWRDDGEMMEMMERLWREIICQHDIMEWNVAHTTAPRAPEVRSDQVRCG